LQSCPRPFRCRFTPAGEEGAAWAWGLSRPPPGRLAPPHPLRFWCLESVWEKAWDPTRRRPKAAPEPPSGLLVPRSRDRQTANSPSTQQIEISEPSSCLLLGLSRLCEIREWRGIEVPRTREDSESGPVSPPPARCGWYHNHARTAARLPERFGPMGPGPLPRKPRSQPFEPLPAI